MSVHGNECLDTEGRSVLRFSREFVKQVERMRAKRFELKSATVNFIVYWKKEGEEEETKIILPELLFERE